MPSPAPHIRSLVAAVVALAATVGAAAPSSNGSHSALPALRVGALFPQHVSQDAQYSAAEERLGIGIAADLVNADGGVAGRRVQLVDQDLSAAEDAPAAVAALRDTGVRTVIGAYSSTLSIPAARAAADAGMIYWESGAVADQVTGQGLPTVFRVGADGRRLGDTTITFAATKLAPAMGIPASRVRVSVVEVDDAYARSVADAAVATATSDGMAVVSRTVYSAGFPNFAPALDAIRISRPDILILASHVADGVAFRHAFVAAGLHVRAFLGSTMAECGPDFGAALGEEAVGVFASDRPGNGFDPATLPEGARTVYARLAAAWGRQHGGLPTEEGLSGFTAAWALFHDVLPNAGAHLDDSAAIAAAARRVDLPEGTMPNGAGIHFSTDPARLGQNERSASVVWQWQRVQYSAVVYPPEYSTGSVRLDLAAR